MVTATFQTLDLLFFTYFQFQLISNQFKQPTIPEKIIWINVKREILFYFSILVCTIRPYNVSIVLCYDTKWENCSNEAYPSSIVMLCYGTNIIYLFTVNYYRHHHQKVISKWEQNCSTEIKIVGLETSFISVTLPSLLRKSKDLWIHPIDQEVFPQVSRFQQKRLL